VICNYVESNLIEVKQAMKYGSRTYGIVSS